MNITVKELSELSDVYLRERRIEMQNKKLFITASCSTGFSSSPPVHIFSIEWDAGGTFFNSTGFVSDETTSDNRN